MRRFFIMVISVVLLISACNNEQKDKGSDRKNGYAVGKTKEDSLYHEVMEGHDAGMAKIGKVRGYIDQIKKSLDSLEKKPNNAIDDARKRSLVGAMIALQIANDEMMQWMDGFKVDTLTDNPELRIKYLQNEKQKVTKVKQHITTSLTLADSLINKQ